MAVHQFEASLAWSHDQSDKPYWAEVYQRAFPDMVHMLDLRHDGWHQRAGRDRAIILASGRSIFVDEKARREAYDDILIEVWSKYPQRGTAPFPPHVPGAVPGWGVKPLDCDFLAYAFEPTRTCYLFPFLGVRAAWAKHARLWIKKASQEQDGFRWVVARNRTYNTVSIAVPIPTLQAHMTDALTIQWGGV
jgi:hypothetical protein